MRIALLTTFAASKKEPLAEVLQRIHAAFLTSGLGEPVIQFSLSDAPIPGFVSAVERVLKRHPVLRRFEANSPVLPGGPAIRQISNRPGSPAEYEPLDLDTLLAIAAGVPKSFPFHNVSIQLTAAGFGEARRKHRPPGEIAPGVTLGDSWWVNGRSRSLRALTVVDADPASKKLPTPPAPVSAVLAACGKAKSTVQVPLAGGPEPGGDASATQPSGPDPEVARAVGKIVSDYRERFAEILGRVAFPHDLPPALEALQIANLGQTAGPKKPALVHAFKPMGYACTGGSGTFTLRRRTSSHLTVEILLDVGTWSHLVTASFSVQGLGFTARLPLPVSRRAGGGQYPIGGEERWRQIVDNLATLVAELDRTFVPAIEAVSGPTPEWYRPES